MGFTGAHIYVHIPIPVLQCNILLYLSNLLNRNKRVKCENTKGETSITGIKKQDGKQKDERAKKIKVNISNRYGYSTA